MALIKAERETTIRWDEDERVVHVWSASPVVWRKMARLGVKSDGEAKQGGAITARRYSLPLTEFRFGVRRPRPGAGQHFRSMATPAKVAAFAEGR